MPPASPSCREKIFSRVIETVAILSVYRLIIYFYKYFKTFI